MIKKALHTTLQELLALNPLLWMQVGGMSVSISMGVLLFSIHQSIHQPTGIALLFLIEFLMVLFSVATFAIYLTKEGIHISEKLGLRKTMGASGFKLFLEISVQTTLLILIAIIFSIGITDVSSSMVGLNFEYILQKIGILHYATLLLIVFLISEGILFIIQGVALAPTKKKNFIATADSEKRWFQNLAKALSKISVVLCVFLAILIGVLLFLYQDMLRIRVLIFFLYGFLVSWCLFNKKKKYPVISNNI